MSLKRSVGKPVTREEVEKARLEHETLTEQNRLMEMKAPSEIQLGILVSENARLKKALSLFQKAFNVVEGN